MDELRARRCSWVVAAMLVVASSAVAAPDWGVRRDPFDRAVVARYRAILARDPHDAILGQLVSLYRRFRTLDELRRSYDAADWATLVVRARLARGIDDAEARAWFDRAVRAKPDDVKSWLAIGELSRATELEVSRHAYREVLALTSHRDLLIVARTALAELARRVGDAGDAVEQLRALTAIDPSATRWLALGDAIRDPREALAAFHQAEATSRDPFGKIEAITRQSNASAAVGDHAAAITALRRALAIAPRGSGLASDLVARIVEEARTGKRAIEELAVFEAMWPVRQRGAFEHVALGELHEIAGHRELAIASYRAAIAAAPREPVGYRHLVALFDRAGEPGEALRVFATFAARIRDPEVQLALALRYGLAREADANATLAALSRSTDAGVHAAIANLYVEWQRFALAAQAYERAAKLDPSYRDSLEKAYAAAGDRDALIRIARAAKRDGNHLADLAQLMLEHGMWLDAQQLFSSALGIDPERSSLWSGRAGANEGLERWDAAAADAARALELSTADESVRKQLRHVVVRDILRTDQVMRYLRAWRTQLIREPAHRDLAALLDELVQSERLDIDQHVGVLRDLHDKFPADVRVASELFDLVVSAYRMTDLELLQWLAARPDLPPEARSVREHAARRATAERDREQAWHATAMRVGTLVDVVEPADRSTRSSRVGLRVAVGAGDTRLLRLGATATHRLSDRVDLTGRLDWTEASTRMGHVRGIGGSAGLSHRLLETSQTLWSAGAALRIDRRDSVIGVAGEAGVDLTSRVSPFGLGLRIGRYLGGGSVGSLELSVEWR